MINARLWMDVFVCIGVAIIRAYVCYKIKQKNIYLQTCSRLDDANAEILDIELIQKFCFFAISNLFWTKLTVLEARSWYDVWKNELFIRRWQPGW